ncbi:MAG: hypothetical protein KKF56_03885 [Nanoarchaeota archaeon]|nr:hypothetical protein [Nanoarchaeota archaeon]
MGLFSKKKKEEPPKLPELNYEHKPLVPIPPRSKEIENDMPPQSLPSFPNNELGDKITQQAVKDNISPERIEGISKPRTMELDSDFPEEMNHEFPKIEHHIEKHHIHFDEIPNESRTLLNESSDSSTINTSKPVFVRIDKFKSGINDVKEIKKTISMLEELMIDMKEIKEKEDNEIREWESEVENIKSRLESIEENVFNKVG